MPGPGAPARSVLCTGLLLMMAVPGPGSDPRPPTGPLVVFNPGSMARPFQELLRAFAAKHPGVVPAQESSGSLEAARKLTDLGKIPDLIAVADFEVFPTLLIPRYASWYALFARSSMVLIYTDASTRAGEITGDNWWRILLSPNVRSGHSDPALDPAGYRALMVWQLAERYYGEPRLAARLAAAVPPRYVRRKSVDLIALVQAGELDYAWEYEAVARIHGFRYVKLPPEINLGDPTRADWYAEARVRVPGKTRSATDSVDFRGQPIVYALTIPTGAPHPETARAFAQFVLSPEGKTILEGNGFTVMERPVFRGPGHVPDLLAGSKK